MATVKLQGGKVITKEGKVSCECCCLVGCPENIIGDMCGILVANCGVGWQQLGTKTIVKEVLFEKELCEDIIIIANWVLGFTADKITFFAMNKDGSTTEVGTTGCAGAENGTATGSVVFVIPKKTIGLTVLSEYACGEFPDNNSSIDGLTLQCAA